MNCTTYTNSGTITSAIKANDDLFHKRLQKLYPCVEDVTKLPQSWSTDSRAPPLGLTHDNLGCYFRGNGRREEDEKFAAAVRTDHYIPPSCLLYYFEIRFVSKGREGFMGVGLTSSQVSLTKLPGWAHESYGYHADDGNTFNGDGRGHPFGPTFTTGDVIGCGYNLVEGKCFFTKNGLNLGKAFDDIPSNILLYPTIGLKTPGEEVRANFGQEDFVYDIEQDFRSLRKNMTLTISNYPINDFGDWQTTLHKLVQSWLLQNSYPNTAEAFTSSTKIDCDVSLQRIQQRNLIQQLVLNGKISEAIRLTNRLNSAVLQNNPNLLFALKCRQFVELISGAENDYQPILDPAHLTSLSAATTTTIDNSNGNGAQPRIDTNGDQIVPLNNLARNNGCNGMIGNNTSVSNNNGTSLGGDKIVNNQQSSSTSSLQELMEIDQPLTSTSNLIDSNHLRENSPTISNNNNHSSRQQAISKNDTNGSVRFSMEDYDIEGDLNNDVDDDEQKFVRLLQFGRMLTEYCQQLDRVYGKNETNEKLLQDTISLIAFTNPKTSSFGKLLDPSEREPLSQLLNTSIVKTELGDVYKQPLEEVMNHLRKLVRLNDSHGRWLVDRLY